MVFFQQCFEGSAHPISSHRRISFIEGSHSSKDLIHFISSKNQSHLIHLIEGSISSHSSHRRISFIEGSHSFHLIEGSISSHSSHRRICSSMFRRICSYISPVWQETRLSGMNYFCVHITVFISPSYIPPWFDEIRLRKHGVFEIFFVVIKQTASCITSLIVSVY
jgi:hypothetical protein